MCGRVKLQAIEIVGDRLPLADRSIVHDMQSREILMTRLHMKDGVMHVA